MQLGKVDFEVQKNYAILFDFGIIKIIRNQPKSCCKSTYTGCTSYIIYIGTWDLHIMQHESFVKTFKLYLIIFRTQT